MAEQEGKSKLGRFGEPATLVLLSLAEGPKHGYAIMMDVKAQMGIALGAGTLYASIAKLQKLGLIEPIESTERTRPYRITASGLKEVECFVKSWNPILKLAEVRLA